MLALAALKDILDSQEHQEALALARRSPEDPSSRRLLRAVRLAELVVEAGETSSE